jgi:hypothetical protein
MNLRQLQATTPNRYCRNMDTPKMLIRETATSPNWSEPETSTYDDESDLQEILASNPHLVAGVPQDSFTVRELNTSSGPIDVCIVTHDGRLTVVECKRSQTTEHRRKIIGQVIDYAAAIRAGGYREFLEAWNARGGPDLTSYLSVASQQDLARNIENGDINLCLAIDSISEDIQGLIEYLSLVTKDSIMVTALQLSYARLGQVEVLLPTIYGAELAQTKAHGTGGTPEKWTWEDLLATLSDPAERHFIERLKELLEMTPILGSQERIWFGKKPLGGIFFHPHGYRYAPFQLWKNSAGQLTVFSNKRIWTSISDHPGFQPLAEFFGQDMADRAKTVPVATLDPDAFWAAALETDRLINPSNDIDNCDRVNMDFRRSI